MTTNTTSKKNAAPPPGRPEVVRTPSGGRERSELGGRALDAAHALVALSAFLMFLALAASPTAQAAADFEGLARHYGQQAGVAPNSFSAERGKSFWQTENVSDSGEKMNCATCHGTDLRQPGKHNKSGKRIEAMAPSANAERYTDLEKIEKWFTRNCKQVLKRECTAREKGDVLRYLQQF